MVGYRAALALILGATLSACASSPGGSQPQAAVPSGSPQIATAPDVPSPSLVVSASASTGPPASPTPAPLTVKEAGAALLAAEANLQKVWFALQDKYYISAPCAYTSQPCNKTEMKAGETYWATLGAALGTYVEALKAIRFPHVAAPAAGAYIKDAGTFRDLSLSASKATTLDTFNARAAKAADARDGTYVDHEQLLKDALGLPVGP